MSTTINAIKYDNAGYSLRMQEEVRRLVQIEERAREIRAQLDRLEQRFDAKVDKLYRMGITVPYAFGDVLA